MDIFIGSFFFKKRSFYCQFLQLVSAFSPANVSCLSYLRHIKGIIFCFYLTSDNMKKEISQGEIALGGGGTPPAELTGSADRDRFPERPRGPEPSGKEHVFPMRGRTEVEIDYGLLKIPTIRAEPKKEKPTMHLEPRIFGEEAIVSAVMEATKGNRFHLVPCEFHNGQDPTPKNLYSYDPGTGRGVCRACHDFIEEYGDPKQKDKLRRWGEGSR